MNISMNIIIISLLVLVIGILIYVLVSSLMVKSIVSKIDKNTAENNLIDALKKLEEELNSNSTSENFENRIENPIQEFVSTDNNLSGYNNALFNESVQANTVIANSSNFNKLNATEISGNEIKINKIIPNFGDYQFLPDNYFEVDLSGLDRNNNFVYKDNEFYPLLLLFKNNSPNNMIVNFTITGKCAENYLIDPTSGLFSKNSRTSVPLSYTILSGSLVPSYDESTTPYGELSYIAKPYIDSSGNIIRQNLYTKCFGPVCYPSASVSKIFNSSLSNTGISTSCNVGYVNGDEKIENVSTLRTSDVNPITDNVGICIYVRGARKYVLKTNANSLNLSKEGCDIIDDQNNIREPLCYKASRFNVLRINGNNTELVDPSINFATPKYNTNINLSNPNLEPGVFLVRNYFTTNKNGKFIYNRDNDIYNSEFNINNVPINNLPQSLSENIPSSSNGILLKYSSSKCRYGNLSSVRTPVNSRSNTPMTIIPFISSIPPTLLDTFNVEQYINDGDKHLSSLLKIKKSGYYRFNCGVSFKRDLSTYPDIYLFGLYRIISKNNLKRSGNVVSIPANTRNIDPIKNCGNNTNNTCNDRRYWNINTNNEPPQNRFNTNTSGRDLTNMMISGINTSSIFNKNNNSLQDFPPNVVSSPYGLSSDSTYIIQSNKDSVYLNYGEYGIFIMIGDQPSGRVVGLNIIDFYGYIEYLSE